MGMSALDLVEALVERGSGWERAALDLQLDGSVSELAGLLESVDPAALEHGELVGYLRLTERVTAKVAALAQRTVALVADRTEALGLHPAEARHELAAALRLSPVTASQRVRVALDLRDRFPATLALMDTGRAGYLHAANLVRETEGLDEATAAAVEARVLPVMPAQTPAETRRAVRDAVVRVDPAAAAERARTAHEQRRIERVPDRDGRTGWYLPLAADVEGELWGAVTARATAVQAARRAAGLDDPGLDALRVDLVVDPCSASTRHRVDRRDRPRRPAAGCRGVPAAARRPQPWCSTCPPPSPWPTTPATYPATARSRPSSPGRWPPTATGSAGPPNRAPAPCSTAAPAATAPAPPSRPTSTPATRSAASPAAPSPPTPATATTSSPTAPATPPRRPAPTSDHSAASTTTPRPTATGTCTTTRDTRTKTWTSPLGNTYRKHATPMLT